MLTPVNRFVGGVIRTTYARGVIPLHLDFTRRVFGIGRAAQVAGTLPGDYLADALRGLGASIGKRCTIKSPLIFDNVDRSLAALRIEDHCHIGSDTLFDLVEPIIIEQDVSIAARVSIMTHFSVGDRPLADLYPTRSGAVTIGAGSNIGMGAIIFHGVRIGRCALIGAGAVVTKDVPDYTVALGVPARPVRDISSELLSASSNTT